MEVWKDIKGYEGYYQVSTHSKIRSVNRIVNRSGRTMKLSGIVMTPTLSGNGYLSHRLCKNGELKTINVHRVVAEAFIPNEENKRDVNHRNGIKTDNRIENLEWATPTENAIHAVANGLRTFKYGEDHQRARSVIQFSQSGNLIKRYCCAKEAVLEHGFDSGTISKACNNKFKTAYGFVWRFEDDLTTYEAWQLSMYNNIIPETGQIPDENLQESGIDELNRLADWIENLTEPEIMQSMHPTLKP